MTQILLKPLFNEYSLNLFLTTSVRLSLQGATKLRDQIEPNEKPTEIPESVVKGVHYTRQATHCVVGVSDFLMTSLARLTVKVGTGVKSAVEESEVGVASLLGRGESPMTSPI